MTTFNVTINGRKHGPTEVRDELTMNDYLREYLGLTGTKFGRYRDTTHPPGPGTLRRGAMFELRGDHR